MIPTSLALVLEGHSSIGRAADSKSAGWGFESLCPCFPPLHPLQTNPHSLLLKLYRHLGLATASASQLLVLLRTRLKQ